jgi:hypothetical protein
MNAPRNSSTAVGVLGLANRVSILAVCAFCGMTGRGADTQGWDGPPTGVPHFHGSDTTGTLSHYAVRSRSQPFRHVIA